MLTDPLQALDDDDLYFRCRAAIYAVSTGQYSQDNLRMKLWDACRLTGRQDVWGRAVASVREELDRRRAANLAASGKLAPPAEEGTAP